VQFQVAAAELIKPMYRRTVLSLAATPCHVAILQN